MSGHRRFADLRDELYRTHPVNLAGLRKRRRLTQARVAADMGTTQSGVARIERQEDALVSTLAAYVSAMGGSLHLVVRFADETEHEVVLW